MTIAGSILLLFNPGAAALFYLMLGLAFVFGILLVLPIGAADMPVVISLLNSYAGLASAATGFAISNNVLIIAGTLDGGSGLILSIVMCKAMNRSITNVLFGAFGSISETAIGTSAGEMRERNLLRMSPCNWPTRGRLSLSGVTGWPPRRSTCLARIGQCS